MACIVKMARGPPRGKKEQRALACQGTFTDHQRRVLGRLLEQINRLERQIAQLTSEIEQRVAPHEELLRRMIKIPVWTASQFGRCWPRSGPI